MKHHLIRLSLWLFLLLGNKYSLYAQTVSEEQPWRLWLQELSEMEDFESVAWQDYEDELEDAALHPLNLNVATREDLEKMPFLTASQVEDIQAYVYRYGGMKSMAELAMIPSISWYQRKLMECFFYVAEVTSPNTFPSLRNIAKYGKHELAAMLKVPFYERKGDVDGYKGSKYKHWLRYQFRYSDYVKIGFVASQDAGEPFGREKNKTGYDFYSYYLQIRNWHHWKNITIGRYRLHEGLGLILNNDFSFGKLSSLTTFGRSSNTIRVHSSRSSANYLQGVAATYTLLKGLDLTGFVSYRKIDATLTSDGNGIQTLLKTGLHRTEREISKQDVASNTLVGGNVNYRSRQGWHMGATALYTSFSLPLQPNKTQLYKRFAPEGDQFWNVSMDYGYVSHRWNVAGETATGNCGAWATINTVSYSFSEHFSLMALQRFYAARYYSLFSNAFSEGSEVQDENGAYAGFNWTPNSKWSVMAYADFAYFAWPKYLTKESTQSWDGLLNVVYQPVKWCSIGGRMRYKERAGNKTERLRLYMSMARQCWNLRTSFDYALSEKGERSQGYMIGESLGYQWRWLKLAGNVGYFHTDDYDSRIYAYEPGLLYNMNFGNYFGEGIRYALMARSEIGSHVLLIAKVGTTNYFDRSRISSGYQEISQSSQTDLEIQLKWKF